MSQESIVQHSKDLCLNFLKKIGAKIDETHGLYTIQIPAKHSQLFGNILKRITFDVEVAETHSCELAILGSNFLSIILSEIRKQAPVVGGHLTRQHDSPINSLNMISAHNCTISLKESTEEISIAVRFYFNVTVKSIKTISMLRWIDVNLKTLEILDFPLKLEINPAPDNIEYKEDHEIDHCHSKAIEFLEESAAPLALKFVELSKDNMQRDIDSVNQTFNRRLKEISQDLDYQKLKLKELDKKILHAKFVETKTKYVADKQKQQNRLNKEEENALQAIERLSRDKNDQISGIEKRYRPVIDVSLIAAQIYSYSSFRCVLALKNKNSEREFSTIFYDPSTTFLLACELCHNRAEQIHLCINSHVSCDFCTSHCSNCEADVCTQCSKSLNPCYICKEILCASCTQKCAFCSDVICNNHSIKCPHCSAITCFFCSDQCEFCSKTFCDPSFSLCGECKKRTCKNDIGDCIECDRHLCPKDLLICSICNENHCRNDSTICKICSQLYSSNCVQKETCKTCKTLTSTQKENSMIQELITINPEFSKHNKWEYSANNRYAIFKLKKFIRSKIIVYDKINRRIINTRKGGAV